MEWQTTSGDITTTTQLLNAYAQLDASNASECDQLIGEFGCGNIFSTLDPYIHVINKPYDRLAVYEHIMHELQRADSNKYDQMHKGTLFFFTSWLAFSVKDFEKAIFYMDSAISEDIRLTVTSPTAWQTTPAARFLLLEPGQPGVAAQAIMKRITDEFSLQLSRFNSAMGAQLSIEQYRHDFVIPNMNIHSFRSIISGLYVFIMEYVERTYMLRLKSDQGGSIEPFLTHLFKGCLIFESLLKTEYGGSSNTLGKYLSQAKALTDLEIGSNQYVGNPVYKRDQQTGYTLPYVISKLPDWRNEDPHERIIAITYGVRNTAGHDLAWPVTFDESVYQELYEAIIDSIFWFIWKVKVLKDASN